MNYRHTMRRPEPVNALNTALVNFLFEKAKELTAEENTYQHLGLTYFKAAKSAALYPAAIRNGLEAMDLNGVGRKVGNNIEAFFRRSFNQGVLPPGLYNAPSAAASAPPSVRDDTPPPAAKKKRERPKKRKDGDDTDVPAAAAAAAGAGAGDRPPAAKRARKPKEYMPKPESGPHAVLVALCMSEEAKVLSLSKADLKLQAQPYCKSSFEPTKEQYYSAWSSVATIKKKGLVQSAGNPPLFFLTPKGRVLGQQLLRAMRDGEDEDMPAGVSVCTPGKAAARSVASPPSSSSALPLPPLATPAASLSSSLSRMPAAHVYDEDEALRLALLASLQHTSSSSVSSPPPPRPPPPRPPPPRPSSSSSPSSAAARVRLMNGAVLPSGAPESAEKKREVARPRAWVAKASATAEYTPTLPPGDRTRDWEVILLLDYREKAGRRKSNNTPTVSDLAKSLEKLHVRHEPRNLYLGDMMWIARRRNAAAATAAAATEVVLNMIIERKNWQDLCGSIMDNRYYEQRARLLHCPLTRVVYIIEGGPLQSDSIDPATCESVMAKFSALFGFQVICTTNEHHTAKVLVALHTSMVHMCSQAGVHTTHDGTMVMFGDFQEQVKKSGKDTMRVFFGKCLRQIRGVSGDVAWEILKRYPSVTALSAAYDACADEDAERMLLADIMPPYHTQRLGPKVSERIRDLFRADTYI